MSICKDFEERRAFPVPNGPAMFYWDDVGHLLRHARALEAMLKKHEWSHGWCVECGNDRPFGHAPDCELAKLLKDVE